MKRLFHLGYRLCLLAMFLLLSMAAWPQGATEAWVRRYNSPEARSQDDARKVVTDPEGNVIVAGDTESGIAGIDILIIKYSGAGIPLWTNRYNGSLNTNDRLTDLAVDHSGNIFVAGYSHPYNDTADWVTIAYSRTGVALWTNHYAASEYSSDRSTALAVDHNGNVFVTGSSYGAGLSGYVTIAYSGAGVAFWTNRHGGTGSSDDRATAVVVDRSGNVFVTGSSGGDYATIAYSATGVPRWTNRYDGPDGRIDEAIAVAVDNTGNVFVTGTSHVPEAFHSARFATIAYSPAGVALWTNHFKGPDNCYDYAIALAVDHNGKVFVTGISHNPVPSNCGSLCYATIAYSGAGVALWTNLYTVPGTGYPYSLALDNSGNVLVTGISGDDYATIKYSEAGVALWTNRYDGRAGSPDGAYDVSVDSIGNVFVTGYSSADYATIAYSPAGVALWTNRYNGPGNSSDFATALALDHRGHIFVTGSSYGAGLSDCVTVAYSEAGAALWTNRYNGPGNHLDHPKAIAADRSSNVFVTGYSYDSRSGNDYATIAYSASGVALWTNRYNGAENSGDDAKAVAVDGSGNVFVTGYSDADYATIAYSGSGVALWTNRYNGPENSGDDATAIAVDGSGNVFVTGYSGGDYATIAYSGSGVALWTNRYNGPGNGSDTATAVAVDHQGNVFVTGSSFNGAATDYATIAYSQAGVALWTNHYNSPANGNDGATAIAVDHHGNVFVTGFSAGTSIDYATVAYSGVGAALWTNRYNGTGDREDRANSVAVDRDGNVFVTGYSGRPPSSYDYLTIAYSGSGVPLWTNRYNGPASGFDQPGIGSCIAVGRDGAVYVTGSSDPYLGSYGIFDYATIKYIWRPHLAMEPLTAGSSIVNLNLSAPPNSSWSILRAPAITGSWTDLGVSLIGTNGSARFTDPNPPANGAFYRVAPP